MGKIRLEGDIMTLVKEHDLLPIFQLHSGTGDMVGSQDYRGKKGLVVIFFDPDCDSCNDFLYEIGERYSDYQSMDAEVLAIGEGSVDEIREIVDDPTIPFPILADPDNNVLGHYADSTPAIFVADRYGEVRAVVKPKANEHFPDQAVILSNLELAELECPECGVPTWPTY